MKSLLKAFRNFILIFIIFVILAIVLHNSQSAREFVTPEGVKSRIPETER